MKLVEGLRSALRVIFEAPPTAEPPLARLTWRTRLIEWSLIVAAVVSFCKPFLDLGTRRSLKGNEAEIYQSFGWILLNSLKEYGAFPVWNPFIKTGWPFVADPFLNVYDPVSTVPILLFGVWDGFKIALAASFLIAALGAWFLGYVLGFGWPARLWMALMYAFAGPAAARFFQGDYDFVLGLAWIPWVVAGLFVVIRTRRKAHAALVALALAFLFFAGNHYYAYYMLFAAAIFIVTMAARVGRGRPRVTWDRGALRIVLVVGLLALALIAIQLLPLLQFRPHFVKGRDLALEQFHTLGQIWLDFTSREIFRPGTRAVLPPEAYYSYIGIWPFLALALLPLAVWKGRRRPLFFFVALLGFAVLWMSLGLTPFRAVLRAVPALTQFQYPTRFAIYAALAAITLAAFGVDAAWKLAAGGAGGRRPSFRRRLAWVAGRTAMAGLGLFVLFSVRDVYRQNQPIVGTREFYAPPYEIASWLRDYDPGTYYVGGPDGWHGALASNRLLYLDAWYGFGILKPTRDQRNARPVNARPHYVIRALDAPPPSPEAVPVRRFPGHSVYAMPESLPFAFAVSSRELTEGATDELKRSHVTPLLPFLASPNRLEVIAEGTPASLLVVLVGSYPGWKVDVDGEREVIENVGGYLATPMRPGVHRYVFRFRSVPFLLGLLVSAIALGSVFALLAADFGWQRRLARLRGSGRAVATALDVIRIRASRALDAVSQRARTADVLLFVGALAVYGVTRFVHLDRFPIYFFADEAIQALIAEEFNGRGWRGPDGKLLPLFFDAHGFWNPLVTVYFQAVGMGLFGKSIEVVRATSAFVTLLGTAAVALTLKYVFRARYWWAGVLLLAATPAWFLHSRTAFETAMTTSFYAGFLLFYLLYRCRSPRFLYLAVLFAALTFYSYGNGQIVIGVVAILLFVFDLPYHWRQRRTVAGALLLGIVLALPYVRFRASRPKEAAHHLRTLDTYLFRPLPAAEKARQFARRYLYGLSPRFWFVANERELVRHRMKGYAQIPTWALPLFVVGAGVCLVRWRSPAHRVLVLAALATPVGGALTEVGITRVLTFVVPATMLSVLGLEFLLQWLRGRALRIAAAAVVFIGLSTAALGMLRDSLRNGPLWFRDYGLYGMQWGARPVYDVVSDYLRTPGTEVRLTPEWANAADVFSRFFLGNEPRVRFQNIDSFIAERRPLTNETVVMMTPAEVKRAVASRKFGSIRLERLLRYPDATPGFYFARLAYSGDADRLFAEEKAERRKPVTEDVAVGGETLTVSHSLFDGGAAKHLFDGDVFTLARVHEANPAFLEIRFPKARPVRGLAADFGSMDFSLAVLLWGESGGPPVRYRREYRALPADPHVEMRFDGSPSLVSKVRIEVKDLKAGETAKIHIREIRLP